MPDSVRHRPLATTASPSCASTGRRSTRCRRRCSTRSLPPPATRRRSRREGRRRLRRGQGVRGRGRHQRVRWSGRGPRHQPRFRGARPTPSARSRGRSSPPSTASRSAAASSWRWRATCGSPPTTRRPAGDPSRGHSRRTGRPERLPRLIGPARAKELIWSGRQVKADEALPSASSTGWSPPPSSRTPLAWAGSFASGSGRRHGRSPRGSSTAGSAADSTTASPRGGRVRRRVRHRGRRHRRSQLPRARSRQGEVRRPLARAPRRSRAARAASSGGTVFTRMPVPCSNPATTAILVWISTYQWNDLSRVPGGAVWTTRLYGASPVAAPRRVSTERGRVGENCACRRRRASSKRDPGSGARGAARRRAPERGHHARRARRRGEDRRRPGRGRRSPGRGRRPRTVRPPPRPPAAPDRAPRSARAGARSTPRGSTVVDHHLHEGPAGGEMMTGLGDREHGEHLGRLWPSSRRRRLRGAGRARRPRARAPVRRRWGRGSARRAPATRACRARRRRSRTSGGVSARCRGRTGTRPSGVGLGPGNVCGRAAGRGDEHPSPLSSSCRSCGMGQARGVPYGTVDRVLGRSASLVILGGGPAGNTCATVAARWVPRSRSSSATSSAVPLTSGTASRPRR